MGPAGDKYGRQVAKTQRTDQQSRHNLVTNAQVQGAIKHVVAHAYRGGHGNQVTAE
jgi:hypothetical protein